VSVNGRPPQIVIAGGGMVGISLALYLADRLAGRIGITLVESVPLPREVDAEGNLPAVSDYHPSFDARSTALSFSSYQILRRLGLWAELERWVCPIETIHVSNRGRFGSSLLHASDYRWPALGYVVENAWLGNVLLQALHRCDAVELRCPARVTAAAIDENGCQLTVEGDPAPVQADLLVVADGAGSALRESLGMGVRRKPYGQHAVVANVGFASRHDHCAFERFTDEGPLALLPLLPTPEAPNRASLVWTLPPERAEAVAGLDEAAFLSALQQAFGYRLGKLTSAGRRHAYPLALELATEQARRHVVVVGNAAHALHPVAGQGFNLALRDVAALGDVIAEGCCEGQTPGELTLLQRYVTAQARDQQQTVLFSDTLPGLFMQADPVIALGRDLALAGLDIARPLKRDFVRHAAGIAALPGELAGA
jgi:2-octaprenyl-6-methoxyphenol hydroxylase